MAMTFHDLKSPLNAIISRARMLVDLGAQLSVEKPQNALLKMVEAGVPVPGNKLLATNLTIVRKKLAV